MSIDHGKVLALADEISATVDHCSPSSTLRNEWAERLRALAQPAEAVEGVIEIMRGVVADMALSVPRQSKTVNQELVFAWHERLSNAYQELRRLTTTAGGDNVHDAAQGAVATVCLVGERYAHGHMVSVELQLASEDVPAPKIGDRYYTHPQAAPAQGDDETAWREGWAMAYSGAQYLYGDDGELQDNRWPMIDWRRDSAMEIRQKIDERGMRALAAAPSQEGES